MVLDERARSLLAEMGIDTYVKRGSGASAASRSPRSEVPNYPTSNSLLNASRVQTTIFFVTDNAEPDAAIIDDLRRALRMAGARVASAGSVSASQRGIVFQAPADAAGTDATNVLVAGTVAVLRGDAQRKRALWHDTVTLLRHASGPEGADTEPSG